MEGEASSDAHQIAKFLSKLAGDPDLLSKWIKNPQSAFVDQGLSDRAKKLLTGSLEALRQELDTLPAADRTQRWLVIWIV